MLDIIAAAIKARLEETAVFKAVDQGFTQRVLKSPPSAVFFLGEDNRVQDDPYTVRETTWHIALMVSNLDPAKGLDQMNGLIDTVRPAFTRWIPTDGCKPCEVRSIRFEAVEDTLLIYTVALTMKVIAETVIQ